MSHFEGEIRDLSHAGLGVVNGPDGRVFFVAGTWPGDVGTFEIISQKKRYGFAKIVSLKQKSPHRLSEVPCRFHGVDDGTCGGCPWIPFAYSDQLARKHHLVQVALSRAKVLDHTEELLPILGSPSSLGYRNRAQVKTDGVRLGFVSAQNKTLVDISECVVLNEECASQFQSLRAKLPNPEWKPRGPFLWNFIEINDQDKSSPASPNVRLPFLQGNHAQNEAMKTWLKSELKKLPENLKVIELFCGSGNFTEVLSNDKNVSAVFAAEFSETSIQLLRSKKLAKTDSLAADLNDQKSWARIKQIQPTPDLLFLDPPREGFETITDFMKLFRPLKHVIYVSCNVETFARDANALIGLGFKVSRIQPIDMFPNTPHAELCAHFFQ